MFYVCVDIFIAATCVEIRCPKPPTIMPHACDYATHTHAHTHTQSPFHLTVSVCHSCCSCSDCGMCDAVYIVLNSWEKRQQELNVYHVEKRRWWRKRRKRRRGTLLLCVWLLAGLTEWHLKRPVSDLLKLRFTNSRINNATVSYFKFKEKLVEYYFMRNSLLFVDLKLHDCGQN